MECTNIKTQLTAYLAHELPIDERSLVRQHLDQCQECRDELVALTKLDQLLDLQPVLVPPVDLNASIMTAIAQTEVAKAKDLSARQVLVWGTGLAAGFCLVLLPLLVWWWQARTGLTPLESLSAWRGAQASQFAGAMDLWPWVLAARHRLLGVPGRASTWFQSQVGSLTAFYGRYVLQITLAAVGTIIVAVFSWKALSRWTERLDEGMGIMRRSRSN